MARGQWTKHTGDCQSELLGLLAAAGGAASVTELYRRGAWGIRTSTVKALLRKGVIECKGTDIWRDTLAIVPKPTLIVSRECTRCPEVLRVTVGEDENEDDALQGEIELRGWGRRRGLLMCGRCIRAREDDELYG